MSNIKAHTAKSKEIFGEASLGQGFQELLDEKSYDLGIRHRQIDHDFTRLMTIGETYGIQGLKEIILHLAMHYKLFGSAERERTRDSLNIMREWLMSGIFDSAKTDKG